MIKYRKEKFAIIAIFILVVVAFLLYTHPYSQNQNSTAVCSPLIKLTVVSGIWCQKGPVFESQLYNNGWSELILSNKNYSDFNLSLNMFVKMGDSLVIAWDFNSSAGDFYDVRVSKLYNVTLFEKYVDWKRVFYTPIENFSSLSKINIIKSAGISNIYINNSLAYTLNDNWSGSIVLISEFASGNFSNIVLNGSLIDPIGINDYLNLVFAALFGIVFVILLFFREEEEEKRRDLVWDVLLTIIIILPIIAFLYNGTVTGYYLILYVPFLYAVYIILEYINKGKSMGIKDLFSFKDEYRKLVYVIIIISAQVVIALIDWFINGTLSSLNFPISSSLYSNLLFYKVEPFIWLLAAVFFFLGSRKEFGTALKVFIIGIFVIFSGIEDLIYNLISLHPLPVFWPWLYVPGTVLGQPISTSSLLIWVGIMLIMIFLVAILPIHNFFIKREKKSI